uniref:CENP-T/Histone H4 histone fold domain-containing protein n=1 Tax=Sphenodon punctatus TaxID=8508 RepID=A0A8D0GEJ9_SPHPU
MKEAAERVAGQDEAVTGEMTDYEMEYDKAVEDEESENDELSMNTPAFVNARAYKHSPLSSPAYTLKIPASKLPPKLPVAKQASRRMRMHREKQQQHALPSSLVKKVFAHYVRMAVSKDAFRVVEKSVHLYFKHLFNDLEAYASHAGRKTVEPTDLELLMRRQALVTDKMPLCVLIEHHLPLEYRKLLIPVAQSGNKVVPHK